MIISPALQSELRPHIQRLLERVEQPAVTLRTDDWWSDLAPDLSERNDTGAVPQTIVAIDALRSTPSPVAPLAEDGRVLFIEVVSCPDVADFDVSGFLWSSGISVIDVVRPVIEADGPWEFAIGIGRNTPVRQMTDAEARAED